MAESAPIVPTEVLQKPHLMAEGEHFSVENVIMAIEYARGNLAEVSRLLGRRRGNVRVFIDGKPEVLAVLTDIREELLDKAESNVFADVEKGDGFSSRFVLATLGKDRGWVPRMEGTGKDGTPLVPPTITFAQYPKEPDAPSEDSPLPVGERISDEERSAIHSLMAPPNVP